MSTDARRLAEALTAKSDEALATLFAKRAVRADESWNDFFDAAEALLSPVAVTRALEKLPRPQAAAIVEGSPLPAFSELGMADQSGTILPGIRAAVGGRDVPALPETTPVAASDIEISHAAELAFTHVTAVAEVLFHLQHSPIALLTGGAPIANEKRRLSELLPIGTDLDDVLRSITDARLASVQDRKLYLSTAGQQWLGLSTLARWSALASSFLATLPESIRPEPGESITPPSWASAEPWNPSWPELSSRMLRRVASRGLATASGATLPWSSVDHFAEMTPYVPQEVDKVFLQNDLTAIAPGLLAPPLELKLRAMAERESTAQASSYRFSEASISRAVSDGETEQSLKEFLTEISLTGIPQALQYLIERATSQRGSVQVHPDGKRSHLTSSDAHLLQTVLVDQAFAHLGLTVDEDVLVSRASAANVAWALTEAKYPVVLLDESGHPVSTQAPVLDAAPDPAAIDLYRPLIDRLRAHHNADSEAAWLARELETAAAGRATLVVEVAMPDGSARELTLEVSGFASGRLRGHDRAAEVERTLPVSHIRAIRPAP